MEDTYIYMIITDGGITFTKSNIEWSGEGEQAYDYVMDIREAQVVWDELRVALYE